MKFNRSKLTFEIYRRVGQFGVRRFKENWISAGSYDTPWQPRQYDYSHPPLRKTYASFNSLSVSYSATEIKWSVTTEYAKYHQYGTDRLPIRRMVYPDPEITERIDTATQAVMRQVFKDLVPKPSRRR